MRALVDDLKQKVAQAALGGGDKARENTPPVASCCRASASTCCWTPARPFWNCPSWQPLACTTMMPPGAGLISGIGRIAGWTA
jgi:3-methylcrotonyl-CoA carboxylase beta subunit